MTVINPSSISGITSITMPSGDGNVLTIHTNDGTERFRIDSSGNVKVGSACTISQDGDVFFTGVTTATTFTGAHSGSGANLTSLPAAQLTGTLPAISGANLTGIAATDNVRTGILDVAGVSTFRNTMNVGAAVTISESGIEASGIGITCANINGAQIGGRRNLVINGDMRVAQRGTSSTGAGYFSVDRFQLYHDNTAVTNTQSQQSLSSSDTPYTSGFRNFFRAALSSTGAANANAEVGIFYRFEAQDIANSGWNYTSTTSYVTLQFWFRCSTNQTFYCYLESQDGTGQSYPFSFTATGNDTWTKIIKTFPGNSNLQFDDDVNYGLQIAIIPFYGTDLTNDSKAVDQWSAWATGSRVPDMASTWLTAGASTFDVTGVQLEVGSQATAFEHRSFNEELLLCKRYFNMIGDGALGAGTAMSDGFLWNSSGTELDFMYTFPVQMRTTPSIYQVTGGNYFKILGGGLNSTTYVDGNFNIQYASKIATSQYATMDTAGTEGRSCHITINNTLTKYGYQSEL